MTATIHPITRDGDPTIRLDMDVATADIVMTAIARLAATDPTVSDLIDPLYAAVSEAMDATSTHLDGCPGLWPDAPAIPLTEPAVLGNDTGDMLAILIPGNPDYLDAITTAVTVAREAGANIDPTDPTLVAEVQQARWLTLNACESPLHDFHPELAPHGPRTPGAVLVTRVDLSHDH